MSCWIILGIILAIVLQNGRCFLSHAADESKESLDDLNPAIVDQVLPPRSRTAREVKISGATLYFHNRAGTEVNVYHMGYNGYRNYFMRLRRNEANTVRSRYGTTWVAYDVRGNPQLLLNNKDNYLVLEKNVDKEIKVIITSRGPATRPHGPPRRISKKVIEVLVIADESVARHHGKNTERYALLLMNVVGRSLQDASLGIDLDVAVTKVIVLKKDPPGLNINVDARKSIESGCKVAMDLRKKGEGYDFSIMLTRKDFKFSGYTPLFRMCVPKDSCTIIRDVGWHGAFVIAHEIGHALGLQHDGEGNMCNDVGRKGSIMSATVYSKHNRYFWSKCSRDELKETISYFSCLNNIPSRTMTNFTTKLPGTYASLDEQCQYYLGKAYTGCSSSELPEPCNRLWCRFSSRFTRRRCVALLAPPLDGTLCGTGKWCYRGKCLPVGQLKESPVHGQWGSWEAWSECSQSCGVGVKRRTRECDTPKPRFEGRPCEGSKNSVSSCSLKDCRITKLFTDQRTDACRLQHGKTWTHFAKEQIMKSVANSGLNCSFEGTPCRWTQDKTGDDFDWDRGSGATPSSNTGPENDHTYGTSAGHYFFIEGSDYPDTRRLKGYKANMISPFVSVPRLCLRFFYHMFGTHVGRLRIYRRNRNRTLHTDKLLWSRDGEQGRDWRVANVSIISDEPYQIVIEAERGGHYRSDVAIDDITALPGHCTQTEEPCRIACSEARKTERFSDDEQFPDDDHSPTTGRFSDEVVARDGMKCSDDDGSNDICIGGQCHFHGCDDVMGSRAQFDQCGVCRGNGTGCILYNGTIRVRFDGTERSKVLFRLPSNSSNVVIKEKTNTRVILGVRGDKFYYFRNRSSEEPLYFALNRTSYRYSTDELQLKDELTAVGKTSGNIVITALSFEARNDMNATFSYRFYASPNSFALISKWSSCSVTCGGKGVEVFEPVCVSTFYNSTTDEQFCHHLRLDSVTFRPCQTEACGRKRKSEQSAHNVATASRYLWQADEFSACSQSCGLGKRTRDVRCLDTLSNNSTVEMALCSGMRPRSITDCETQSCSQLCQEPAYRCRYYKQRGFCLYGVIRTLCCLSCRTALPQSLRL